MPKKLIRVGVFPMPPMNYFDSTGKATGLYPDLIRAILQEEHWQSEFIPCNWSQCLEKLQNEEIDLMTTIAHTPERALVMNYSKESIAEIRGQLFVLPDNKIDNIGDLEGKPVGIMHQDINGINFLKIANSLGVNCEIIEFATHKEIFEAIHQHRIVAGVTAHHYGHTQAKLHGVVGSSIVFSPFSVYFAAKKDSNYDLLAHIDTHIARWKQDSDSIYYKSINHWMGGEESNKVIPRWVLWLGSGIIILALLLFIINRALKLQVKNRTRDLQASEKKYRQLIESVNSIILRWDGEGRILFLNKFGQEIFGFTESEIIGHHVVGTIVANTDSNGANLGLMIKDIFNNPEKYTLNENENTCKDGRLLTIQWTNQAIVDDQGVLKEILSVGTNVTEQRKLEVELRQAQKFEAIATLSSGIAHDFNNILSAILGFAELAKHKAEHGQEAKEQIGAVVSASYRAKELVQQILTFSHKTPKRPIPIMPRIIVKESLKLLRATLPSSIELCEEISATDLKVLADPVEIQQVVINLCTNALHSMAGGRGKLQIKLTPRELDQLELADKKDISPGSFIELTVCDTGSGMNRQTQERIFEPYFTTKEIGEGTGLGLSLVHVIVRECGGFIKLESAEGKGTTFHVYFPVMREDLLPKKVKDEATENLPTGTERIMIIDDETSIIGLLSLLLEDLGYRVTPFTSSKKAMDEFAQNPLDYDLILTDLTMPDLNGSELAVKILKIKPETPIILCTGQSASVTEEQFTKLGVKKFLLKPIGINKLANTVRQLLDG